MLIGILEMFQNANRHRKKPDMEIVSSTWWEKEIQRRATTALDYLLIPLIIIVLVMLCIFAFVLVYIPEGGDFFGILIPESAAKFLMFFCIDFIKVC